MHIHCKLMVCQDCLFHVANGRAENSDPRWSAENCEAGMESEGAESYHPGDDENEFSWSSCDLCGSGLGGSRHEIVGLCSHEGCADNYRDKDEGSGEVECECVAECDADGNRYGPIEDRASDTCPKCWGTGLCAPDEVGA